LNEKYTFHETKTELKKAIKTMRNPLGIGIALHNLATINYFEIQKHNEFVENPANLENLNKQKQDCEILEKERKIRDQAVKAQQKRKYELKINQLKRQMKLSNNKMQDLNFKKKLRKLMDKQTMFDKNDEIEKENNLNGYGAIKIDLLENSNLPKGVLIHPINDFPSTRPMDIKYASNIAQTIETNKNMEGALPLLFTSLWLQTQGFMNFAYANKKEILNSKMEKLLSIKIIEDCYKNDKKQDLFISGFSSKTCNFIGEILLSHSKEFAKIKYWLNYAQKQSLLFKNKEDLWRSNILLGAYYTEKNEKQKSTQILSKTIIDISRNNQNPVLLSMANALLGISLKKSNPNKSDRKIEEAREIKKKLTEIDERKIVMILPNWSIYDPNENI